MARTRTLIAGICVAALCVGGALSPAHAKGRATIKYPKTQLDPLKWTALDGWADDDHAAAFGAFLKSCRAIVAGAKSRRDRRPMFRALVDICRKAVASPGLDGAGAREFFERHFRPALINKVGETEGFITGYYEPVVVGSPFRTEEFQVPLYQRPSNLIPLGKRRKAGEFPNNVKVGRRVGRRKIVPYYDRTDIENGALESRGLEICWVKDPIDAFFMQIQGSARIDLGDGEILRLNYDAHNGHPYTPVGRILIERGIVPKDEMSMQRIRQWMEANPAGGRELRLKNKSFVFFRTVKLDHDAEPRGAQGVALTPGRSIAVDRSLHVYGTLMWIDANLPIESEKPDTKFRHLMVAQDTGSAIVGPARADIYFGATADAENIAGRLRHNGRFVVLIPQRIAPDAKDRVPLPQPRPAMGIEIAQPKGKRATEAKSAKADPQAATKAQAETKAKPEKATREAKTEAKAETKAKSAKAKEPKKAKSAKKSRAKTKKASRKRKSRVSSTAQ